MERGGFEEEFRTNLLFLERYSGRLISVVRGMKGFPQRYFAIILNTCYDMHVSSHMLLLPLSLRKTMSPLCTCATEEVSLQPGALDLAE